MALWCISAAPAVFTPSSTVKAPNGALAVSQRSVLRGGCCVLPRRRRDLASASVSVSASASAEEDEEERPSRNPLDFPYEWERPKPPSRPNVFPKFPAMTTPLPTWLPYDVAPDDEIDVDEEDLEEQDQPDQYIDE